MTTAIQKNTEDTLRFTLTLLTQRYSLYCPEANQPLNASAGVLLVAPPHLFLHLDLNLQTDLSFSSQRTSLLPTCGGKTTGLRIQRLRCSCRTLERKHVHHWMLLYAAHIKAAPAGCSNAARPLGGASRSNMLAAPSCCCCFSHKDKETKRCCRFHESRPGCAQTTRTHGACLHNSRKRCVATPKINLRPENYPSIQQG